MRRQGLLSTTGLALLALIIGLTMHEWEGAVPVREKPPKPGPALILEQVDARNFNQQGGLRYELRARELTRMHQAPVTALTNPELTLHSPTEVWAISAGAGQVTGDDPDIVLRDAVRASRRGQPPLSLNTGELHYSPATGMVRTPGQVDIQHPGGRTRAGAMQADLNKGVLKLEQQVESRYEGAAPPS